MNSVRKLGFLTAAFMLAAFALPASAASTTKSISLSVTNQPLSTSTTLVQALIQNTGNSNANSFELDWSPSSNFLVSGATAKSPTGVVTTGTCAPGRCVFIYQLPTKTSVTITLTGVFVDRCTPKSIVWTALAWTGGPGTPSTSFAPGTATTAVSASCKITFAPQPTGAITGSTITGSPYNPAGPFVSVTLKQNGVVTALDTDVSLSASEGCATATATRTVAGVAIFTSLKAAVPNPACLLTATAAGYDSGLSQSFEVVPPGKINFTTPPTNAFIGSPITGSPFNSAGDPVTVQLLRAVGVPALPGTSVTVSGAACAIGPATAFTDASGFARFSTLTSEAPATKADCQLTAVSSPGYDDGVSLPLFDVVQPGQLGCPGDNNTFGAGGAGDLVVNGTRLDNVNDPTIDPPSSTTPPGCEIVPYVVSATCPDGVTGACTDFIYDPLHQGTHMAFVFHWEWPLESIPLPGIDAIQNTVQLFINGSTTPLELDLCPEIVPDFAGDGTFIGLAPGSPPPDDQEFPTPPGTQAGCLVRRIVKQVGGQIQVIEDAYVQGDYTATRPK